MSQDMTEEEAARFVRATLRLMMERIPREAGGTLIHAGLLKLINDMEAHHIPVDPPPWADEPTADPVPVSWDQVAEGDWARGGDGVFYLVKANRAENGRAYVTIQVKGQDRTYPREPGVEVLVKRGPVGMAVDVLASVGMDPAVLASG